MDLFTPQVIDTGMPVQELSLSLSYTYTFSKSDFSVAVSYIAEYENSLQSVKCNASLCSLDEKMLLMMKNNLKVNGYNATA